ncbi:MAG: radical SAM peptide maturase, partial [Bacteroidales bacterium]|nr:radical SAM peptide maturase [Bacteroidales bacterium]
GTCIPFSLKLYLTVNGKILPCEKISHDYFLGIIEENNVFLDFNKISNLYNSMFTSVKSICLNCYKNTSCLDCIFIIKNILTNKFDCYKHSYNDAQKYFSSKITYLENNSELIDNFIY